MSYLNFKSKYNKVAKEESMSYVNFKKLASVQQVIYEIPLPKVKTLVDSIGGSTNPSVISGAIQALTQILPNHMVNALMQDPTLTAQYAQERVQAAMYSEE